MVWARQLVGNRCAVGNQVVARVNELHTGVPECPIEHPGYKSGWGEREEGSHTSPPVQILWRLSTESWRCAKAWRLIQGLGTERHLHHCCHLHHLHHPCLHLIIISSSKEKAPLLSSPHPWARRLILFNSRSLNSVLPSSLQGYSILPSKLYVIVYFDIVYQYERSPS